MNNSVLLAVAAVIVLALFIAVCAGVGIGVSYLANHSAANSNNISSAPIAVAPNSGPWGPPVPMQPITPAQTSYGRFHSERAAGRHAAALTAIDEALRYEPENSTYSNDKAWLLATCSDQSIRDGKQAIKCAEKACAISPGNPMFLDTLAAAYAEDGQFEVAVEKQTEALSLLKQTALRPGFERRLKLYQDEKPCRENADGTVAEEE